jgi:hypothetical protein
LAAPKLAMTASTTATSAQWEMEVVVLGRRARTVYMIRGRPGARFHFKVRASDNLNDVTGIVGLQRLQIRGSWKFGGINMLESCGDDMVMGSDPIVYCINRTSF